MERVTLVIRDRPREYLLFAPHGPGRPLVVFLHGAGGTAAWADDETGWSALAARENFALALPEGLAPDPDKPSKFLTNPPRWNDGGEMRNAEFGMRNESPEPASIPHSEFRIPQSDDVAFLAALLDDAAGRVGVDRSRAYLSGFSNGAGMTFRAAAELADRFAAVAPVAGHCWVADPKPARPVPTFYVIGTLDPLVPVRGGDVRSPWQHRFVRRPPVSRTLETWATAIGCEPVPVVQSEMAGVRTEVYPGPVEFRTVYVEGLGHHWPGGKGMLNHRIAGPPSSALDGTLAVWEFFGRHVLA